MSDLRAERLLASGGVLRTRPRAITRAERWLTVALVLGGVLGLSYHVLAPLLVAALKAVLIGAGY